MNSAPFAPLAELDIAPWRQNLFSLNTLLQALGAGLGLLGQHLINQHNPLGFIVWLGSNAALLWLQFRMRLFLLVLLHAVYFGMCVQGLVNWIQ